MMRVVLLKVEELLLQQQPFYGSLDFVRYNLGEPVPEETFTYSHLSWSSIIPYLLPPSFTTYGILLVQFMCLTVFFHNLSPSFLWSGILHFILHAFVHPIIVFFSQHMPLPLQVEEFLHIYGSCNDLRWVEMRLMSG